MPKLDTDLLRDKAYIDGEWRDARSGARFPVKNPANGERIAEVADLAQDDVRDAIEAAERSFVSWRSLTAKDRAGLLRRWYELIMGSAEELARLMTAEQGKPLAESRGEVAYGASFIEWFAEEGKRVYGDVIPTNAPGRRIMVVKQPIGVVAAITPWNFPIAMITRKVGPALAAGCPVVLKPASATPLSALALAELSQRAGLPRGVFNVVPSTRSAEIGRELTTHPGVKKSTFTGSTEIGKQLMAQCASTVKKVSLELGGNAPFIVFDDADLDEAVKGAMASKFRNMGQTCVCANRILVQDGVYDAFAQKLDRAVAGLKVGDGSVEGIEQGPLINMAAVKKVEAMIADGLTHGAKITRGGKRHALGGSYFEPTIIQDATAEMDFAHEEIFGPVATLFRFKEEADAVRMANDTDYGLAAYFYARDLGRIFRVLEGLEYGIVGVNEGLISTEVAPFGGVKQSGIGREGSKYGIEEFLEIKYAALGGLGMP